MDNFDWDGLQDDNAIADELYVSDDDVNNFIDGGDDDADFDADDDFDVGGDADFDNNDDLFVQPEPDFQMGFAQAEQIGFGGGRLIQGDNKLQKLMQRIEAADVQYKSVLASDLGRYFRPEDINSYVELIESKIPKYEYKNSATLAGAFYMRRRVQNLTARDLAKFSTETGIRDVDLYRYYKLLNLYL